MHKRYVPERPKSEGAPTQPVGARAKRVDLKKRFEEAELAVKEGRGSSAFHFIERTMRALERE